MRNQAGRWVIPVCCSIVETRERVAVVEGAYKPTPSAMVQRIHVLRPIRTGERIDRQWSIRHRAELPCAITPRRTFCMRRCARCSAHHVKQAGSVVEPGRLRFDFSHYSAMTDDELSEVERLVNQQILANTEVATDIMDLEQALATGAMALFGEKYGESVRVVSIPGFSRELCGGTHVRRTGDIGLFKIVYEGSISAGVRRIEAITGEGALEHFQQASGPAGRRPANCCMHPTDLVVEHLEKLLEQQKILEREYDQLKKPDGSSADGKAHRAPAQTARPCSLKRWTGSTPSSFARLPIRCATNGAAP